MLSAHTDSAASSAGVELPPRRASASAPGASDDDDDYDEFAGGVGGGDALGISVDADNLGDRRACCCITLRSLVSQKKRRFVAPGGVDLDLTYITNRIVAMGWPSSGFEAMYRNPAPRVRSFLDGRHPNAYRVWNLCSEREYDPGLFGGLTVERFAWADHTPPPMAMMLSLCESMALWLENSPSNVAAIHCKAGKGRTGTAIAAFLLHARAVASADAAIALFGQRRTRNGKGITIPSQFRYVRYYSMQVAALLLRAGAAYDPVRRGLGGPGAAPESAAAGAVTVPRVAATERGVVASDASADNASSAAAASSAPESAPVDPVTVSVATIEGVQPPSSSAAATVTPVAAAVAVAVSAPPLDARSPSTAATSTVGATAVILRSQALSVWSGTVAGREFAAAAAPSKGKSEGGCFSGGAARKSSKPATSSSSPHDAAGTAATAAAMLSRGGGSTDDASSARSQPLISGAVVLTVECHRDRSSRTPGFAVRIVADGSGGAEGASLASPSGGAAAASAPAGAAAVGVPTISLPESSTQSAVRSFYASKSSSAIKNASGSYRPLDTSAMPSLNSSSSSNASASSSAAAGAALDAPLEPAPMDLASSITPVAVRQILKDGDVILSVNGLLLGRRTLSEVTSVLAAASDPILLQVLRRGAASAASAAVAVRGRGAAPPPSSPSIPRPPASLSPSAAAAQYMRRVALALGPWAVGADPTVVPAPRVFITEVAFLRGPPALLSAGKGAGGEGGGWLAALSRLFCCGGSRPPPPAHPVSAADALEEAEREEARRLAPLFLKITSGPSNSELIFDSRLRPSSADARRFPVPHGASAPSLGDVPLCGWDAEALRDLQVAAVAGDFVVGIYSAQKPKKPIACATLHTSFLPLPRSVAPALRNIALEFASLGGAAASGAAAAATSFPAPLPSSTTSHPPVAISGGSVTGDRAANESDVALLVAPTASVSSSNLLAVPSAPAATPVVSPTPSDAVVGAQGASSSISLTPAAGSQTSAPSATTVPVAPLPVPAAAVQASAFVGLSTVPSMRRLGQVPPFARAGSSSLSLAAVGLDLQQGSSASLPVQFVPPQAIDNDVTGIAFGPCSPTLGALYTACREDDDDESLGGDSSGPSSATADVAITLGKSDLDFAVKDKKHAIFAADFSIRISFRALDLPRSFAINVADLRSVSI